MNPIQYLINNGFKITSDPTWFKRYGERELYAYGKNVDSYCGGFHRAHDLVKYHGAGIPAIANATVLQGTGWNTFGWTLVLGFKDKKGRAFQVIYGHLNENPLNYLKVGQNVKKGQIVAYQGTSNNLGVSMASHLHIQFQNYQSLNEWNFTCLGISPLSMDISQSSPTSGTVSQSKVKQKKFNKYTVRKNSNQPYFKGVIRSTNGFGAGLRKYSNGRYNKPHGNDIPDGEIVFIYQVMSNGFARVFSPNNDGFVHLDQIHVTKVF